MPYADNPDLRRELKNGVCLCHRCHQAVHTGILAVQLVMRFDVSDR